MTKDESNNKPANPTELWLTLLLVAGGVIVVSLALFFIFSPRF